MSEIIEKTKKNKTLAIGVAGALGAGSVLGYSEIHKAKPTNPVAQPTIEIKGSYQNSAHNEDGDTVFYSDTKPREIKVVRSEDGQLTAETIPGGNPVEGSVVEEVLEAYTEQHSDK